MKYFAILSSGCYSDYSPVYYMGEYPLSEEEFKLKGKEMGDLVISEYENLPEREHTCTSTYCCFSGKTEKTEKYDPVSGNRVRRVDNGRWNDLMVAWLTSLGFVELPENIPEINIEYSDVPHN